MKFLVNKLPKNYKECCMSDSIGHCNISDKGTKCKIGEEGFKCPHLIEFKASAHERVTEDCYKEIPVTLKED